MDDARRKTSVPGEAVVNVRPDRILVSFWIETGGAAMSAAKPRNSAILERALPGIKAQGAPGQEVQTSQLQIDPCWRDGQSRRKGSGVAVRNAIFVTLSEAGGSEALVSAALEPGGRQSHGMSFQTSEFKKCREEACEPPLKAAEEKTDTNAAVLRRKAGPPLRITARYMGSSWQDWRA